MMLRQLAAPADEAELEPAKVRLACCSRAAALRRRPSPSSHLTWRTILKHLYVYEVARCIFDFVLQCVLGAVERGDLRAHPEERRQRLAADTLLRMRDTLLRERERRGTERGGAQGTRRGNDMSNELLSCSLAEARLRVLLVSLPLSHGDHCHRYDKRQ
jgi:hypothetical protein